jgi:hypothetical protein
VDQALKKLKKTNRKKISGVVKEIILPDNHRGRYYGNRKIVGIYLIKYFRVKK